MRIVLLACLLLLTASCSTQDFSKPSAPTTWVAINFEANEKISNSESAPVGFLSKMTLKEKPNGEARYSRSKRATILLNGINFRKLELGAVYALTHLESRAGRGGITYIFCDTNRLSAFRVLPEETPQAGQNIIFSSEKRNMRFAWSANFLTLETNEIQNRPLASYSSPEGKAAFEYAQIKQTEQLKIKSPTSCGKHNYTSFMISDYAKLVQMKPRQLSSKAPLNSLNN